MNKTLNYRTIPHGTVAQNVTIFHLNVHSVDYFTLVLFILQGKMCKREFSKNHKKNFKGIL